METNTISFNVFETIFTRDFTSRNTKHPFLHFSERTFFVWFEDSSANIFQSFHNQRRNKKDDEKGKFIKRKGFNWLMVFWWIFPRFLSHHPFFHVYIKEKVFVFKKEKNPLKSRKFTDAKNLKTFHLFLAFTLVENQDAGI